MKLQLLRNLFFIVLVFIGYFFFLSGEASAAPKDLKVTFDPSKQLTDNDSKVVATIKLDQEDIVVIDERSIAARGEYDLRHSGSDAIDIITENNNTIKKFSGRDAPFRLTDEALKNHEIKFELNCEKNGQSSWCKNKKLTPANHLFELRRRGDIFGTFQVLVNPKSGQGNEPLMRTRSIPCDGGDDRNDPKDRYDFNNPYGISDPTKLNKYEPTDCVYFEIKDYEPQKEVNIKLYHRSSAYDKVWKGNNQDNGIRNSCNGGAKTNNEGKLVTDAFKLVNAREYVGVLSGKGDGCSAREGDVRVINIFTIAVGGGKGDERRGKIGLGSDKKALQGLIVQPPCDTTGDKECVTAVGKISATPQGFLKAVLSLGIGFAGLIAFLLLLWGGFQIIMSQGNAEKVQNGQAIITSAIIGLLFILASVFLLGFIGGNIIGIPQFRLGSGGSGGGGSGGGSGLRAKDPNQQAAYERAFTNCRQAGYNEQVRKACEDAINQQFGAK